MAEADGGNAARLGLGLAAVGRPAYITTGRESELGDAGERTPDRMNALAHRLLDRAWDAGVRYFDVARSYGDAEQFLGSWLAQHPSRRRELVVGSKWGYEYVGGWRMDAAQHERKEHSPGMLSRQWPETVRALGGRPDVYYVHSVTPDSPALIDAALLDRLREFADSGIRVGLSTSGRDQASVIHRALELADTPFTAVQSTWNLMEQSAGPALQRARASGWLVVVKEALANGRLALAPAGSDVAVQAAQAGIAPQDLALGAALARDWADYVLSGAASEAQLAENLAARPIVLEQAEIARFAVPTASYWSDRAALVWS